MNINRHNYEEYFLLYVDHELKADERAAVELFIQENPDLREELRMLEQTVLRPEKKISFSDKASLLKSTIDINSINESNYEEYFILYGDDELTNTEKDSVEQFVYKNPQHQVDFELFQQARISADNAVVFPDKQLLYRSEKDEKVVVLRWWKIAVAAAVIFLVGTAALYFAGFIGQNKNIIPEIATKNPKKASTNQNTESVLPENTVIPKNSTEEVAQSPKETISPSQQINPVQVKRQNAVDPKENKVYQTPYQAPVQQLIADNQKNIQNKSNPENPSSVKPPEAAVAKIEKPANDKTETVLVDRAELDKAFAKLEENDPRDNQAEFTSNNRIEVLNTSVTNKGKMRGFFRKVGRVVDKATSFGNSAEKDTDKKGVRIASFEIALK